MARICSRLKILFDGVTLIDGTMEFESEPRLSGHGREIQEVKMIGAASADYFARGNTSNTFTFQRRRTHADWYDAFMECIDFPISIPSTKGNANFTLLDEDAVTPLRVWNLSNCVVESSPGFARHRFSIHTVTLRGGEFVLSP